MSRRAYLLLAFVFTAQLTIAALFPVMPEEAYHWNFGQHPDWSYYDHPPMIAWSIAVGHALLGDTPLGVRLIPLLFSLGTTLVLARLANRLYGPRAAGWVILLLALEPAVFTIGGWGFPDSPLLLFWSLCLAGVWKATETGNGRWWLAAGAALGLGMLSKYTCALIVPSVFLYLLTCRRDRRWLATPWPYLAGVVSLLVFMPVFYWNWTHDWASFRFQGKARFQAVDAIGLSAGLENTSQQWLMILPLTVPLAGAACVWLCRARRPADLLLFWSFAPAAVFFLLMGWTPSFHLLWPLPAYLGLTVAMAGAVVHSADRISRFYAARRAWLASTMAIGLVMAGLYADRCIPWFPTIHGPYGWDDVATRARRELERLPADSFYVGLGRSTYWCASELAFHLQDPERVHGNNVFGREALQYRYWSDPAELIGRDAVVVVDDYNPAGHTLPLLRMWFDQVEPAGEVVVPQPPYSWSHHDVLHVALFRAHGYHARP